jgi:hypothetical protein
MKFLNESGVDRLIRVIAGVVILALGWTGMVSGTFGLVLKILGFVPLLTGIIGWCPLYALFKFRTNKVS